MSTQDDSRAIPFAFAHEQSPVRLLELPPSLLSLIENSTFKGSAPVLKIKAPPVVSSTDGSTATTSSSAIPPSAVLTTATETFTIRSVHSSNSIYILKPVLIPTVSEAAPNDDGDGDSDTEMVLSDLPPKPGMIVTSICSSHLELVPSKPNTELILRALLTEYTSPDTPLDLPSDAPSKSQIISDTPVSDAEFAQGWIDVTGFELNGKALRLSPASGLLIFRAAATIMYAAPDIGSAWRAEGVDFGDIIQAIDNDGELEEWPKEAVRAVMRGASETKKEVDGSIIYIFNASHAAAWVGKHLLLANPDKSFRESEFMNAWKEALPDDCIDHVDLKALDGIYTQSVLGVIRYIHGSAAVEAGVSSTASKKKKWHEKFAASKNR
ncbi:hypothetical protein DRE_00823 [Drechslerella stenobrocha 248]|uniref:Sister chromatid cohesion protein Dcc1 n=1 Tax=Drechslerella stenobrocha 248 TaxID=1043628 RepID=W7HQI3_9PEZI|nr:hypothetical protein DRE_00823 [Drechslerella stenobrocha 248]